MHTNRAPLLAVQAVGVGSALLSASYFFGWGPTWPLALGLGAFALAIDLTKPHFFTACAQAIRDERWGAVLVSGFVGLLLFAVSMLSIDGALIKLRSDAGAGRGNIITKVDDARATEKRLLGELEKLAPVRPTETAEALEAKVQTSVAANVWVRSKECKDVTQKDTQKACEPAFAMRAKMAMAKKGEELERDLKAAQEILKTTERPNAADPQLATLSRVTGWTEDGLTLWIMFAVGLLIDLIASFGPALLTPPKPADPVPEPKPEAPALTNEQQAREWVLEQLAASNGKLLIHNQAIAARYTVDPGTVTRWRRKWLAEGLTREARGSDGRQIEIRLARHSAVK